MGRGMNPIPTVRFGSAEFKADPYRFYARLRAEAPVHRVALPGKLPAWLIARYDDVAAALKDERLVKDRSNAARPGEPVRQPWMPAMFRPLTRNMLDLDPPDHTRLRALVQRAFSPRLVEQISTRIESVTGQLLDAAADRVGSVDLIRDYALPLPTTIIAEMLGVPSEDRERFHGWSKQIVAASPSGWGMLAAIPSVMAFMRFIRRLIRRRRADPRDDLTSALVQAEEAGQKLSEDELLAMIFLLLIAGHETTVNLIGNGTLALLRHPDQLEKLRSEPRLMKTGVEELLRYDSPLETATERFAHEDIRVAGTTIPRGELVYAVLASANRDQSQFPNPDALDVTREPNRHLAFGFGIHYCLGAPLARLEGQIAIAALLRRSPDLRLAVTPGELRWKPGLVLRGLKELPVLLRGRRSVA
jgi:cytochrome P450